MAAAKKLFAGDTRPTRLVYEIDKVAIGSVMPRQWDISTI